MEELAILAPQSGIKTDAPVITLAKEFSPRSQNVWVKNGRIERATMRLKEFSAILPDEPTGMDYFTLKNLTTYLILMTSKDIAYRDDTNDRFVYITPQYTTGTASFVNGDATVTFAGGADTANMKAGDYIKTGNATASSDDTWYQVLSITDATHLELTQNYAEASSGAAVYILRDTFAGAITDLWDTTYDDFDDYWMGTNNGVDFPVYWDGSTTTVTTIPNAPKASCITYHEGYTILGRIASFPQREQWSDYHDFDNWTTGDAGTNDIEGSDGIVGFAKWQNFIVIFKEKSIILQWNVTTDLIFNTDTRVRGVGCNARESIIEKDNLVYFWSNDNRFRVFNGLHANQDLSEPISDIVDVIAPNYEERIVGTYIEELKQLWWAVPSGPASTYNDLVLTYDLESKSWGKLDLEVICFGAYITETNLTWDTLPYATWEEWAGKWDDRTFTSGAPIDLIGNRDKYIYRVHASEQDNVVDFTGYFELMSNALGEGNKRKRLLRYRTFWQKESGGTISLQIRTDDKSTLETVESKNLDDQSDRDTQEVEVLCDYSGKFFSLYASATNAFKFIGIIYEFEIIGDR